MDIAKIEELIHIVKDAKVSELTLREDGSSIMVRKGAASAVQVKPAKKKPAAEPKPAAQTHPDGAQITAPMVGIFHATAATAQLGATIKPGQVVGAIESMKLMNDVVSSIGGTIIEVAVEDGLPVEYGQMLFRVERREAEEK